MSYTRVIIEDLMISQSKEENISSKMEGRRFIEQQHKLSEFKERDKLVWEKSQSDSFNLFKAKKNWKAYMKSIGKTNKSDFYTQKAKLWT